MLPIEAERCRNGVGGANVAYRTKAGPSWPGARLGNRL